MSAFGRQLALMHISAKQYTFGFETDNFIGKLPQMNTPSDDWATFYVSCRLLPHLKLALKKQELAKQWIPTTTRMILRCEEVIGRVTPALLHGDLWNGNYFVSQSGKPYLVDPAVYYGHNEVDLALSKLFGGFSKAFYEAYHEVIPPHDNQKEVTDVYQLYYLLVHLNLFGGSYRNAVLSLLKQYFL